MPNLKAKKTTKRVSRMRATLRLHARPVRRCRECLLVANEVAPDFVCEVGVCPHRFELVAMSPNGIPLS